ncbi:MAG: hypothetical protein HND44_13850 [Chloroflexi bacterium]|nr:prolipoprotein diacylglyceryl transferase [Ardenticatenaceae bacterium]MBL1129559.1 hypothetical protein [Chloroflexota bacterium]NOG35640.1 hypothetical protein [Chloroflexota bacterium]GIK58474.1 MAG: prolipoprotein diacylglyceryl transferase [Chloroflexota bacterium]
MLPTLPIGPVIFPTAGLVIIFGAWFCLWVIEKAALRLQLDAQATYTLAVVGLFAGFLGARLTFVALHWPAYQQNLIGILWPLTSGYEPVAGVVIGSVAAFFYGRARKLPFAGSLDALIPGLILGLMVISLADFLGGPGYGTLTAVPWGFSQYGVRRHPVQLYELLAGALTLLVWWRLVKRRRYEGQLFLTAVALTSAARLFLDAFRDNTWIISNGYHGWQLVTFATLLLSLILLAHHNQNQ